ncbi:MAG: flagellar protein FlgN [Pseudomonadales bacterium]|nr:flagellar protein FlgN [Pseudomonadales bacterium]
MDASVCHDLLERILAEETRALTELEAQLEREYDALAKQDVAALDESADVRAWQLTRLIQLERERQHACATYGYPADIRGLAALLDWCDPTRKLIDHYQDRVARAIRCRDYNSRNAALVNARMGRIESMLGALSADSASARVYGRDGATRANSSGRLLNAEA